MFRIENTIKAKDEQERKEDYADGIVGTQRRQRPH